MVDQKGVVLQLIKGLDIGGVNGGAERFSMELSFRLKKLGYKIFVCAFFKMDTFLEQLWMDKLLEKRIELFYATNWQGNDDFSSYTMGIEAVSKFLEKQQIHFIHSHFQLGTIAAIYLKYKFHIPIILRTAHNVNEWDHNFYGWIRKQIFSKYIYPIFLDAEVGVSKAIVDQLSKHPGTKLCPKKQHLIYNGIELQNYQPEDRIFSNHNKIYKIGSVGRLSEQKGFINIIQAIPLIIEEFPNIQFTILGDGPQKDLLLEEAHNLGVSEYLDLKGQVSDVYAYLKQFYVFVSSSLWEGLPTAILEAAAARVPIIATNIPGNREIIEDNINGWLVLPSDPTALALKIIKLLKLPELRMRFSNTAARKINLFSMEEVTIKYDHLFFKLLRSKENEKKK